ncbi:MAG TPA: cupin domain-containing protein, partial [Terriglobales bacterium]|nr:cupin domain-containing protein [Terriglobales bacterium]
MDPLSEVLSVLKPRSYLSGGFKLGNGESIRFPAYEGIKCYAGLDGECWLQLEGEETAVLVRAGDCFVLPKGRPFVLTTDRATQPMDFKEFLAELQSGKRTCAEGGCHFAGGHFLLTGGPAEILLGILPPVVHLKKDKDKEAMRWSLQRLKEELEHPQPGGTLVTQQLAYLMLVQALRLHLTDGTRCGVGWLFALADAQMHTAIACMHEEPGRAWTVQELATRVGMSRSVFAERFK